LGRDGDRARARVRDHNSKKKIDSIVLDEELNMLQLFIEKVDLKGDLDRRLVAEISPPKKWFLIKEDIFTG
jgi:hypothetical protein